MAVASWLQLQQNLGTGLYGLAANSFKPMLPWIPQYPSPQSATLNLPVMGSGSHWINCVGFLPSSRFLMMQEVNWWFMLTSLVSIPNLRSPNILLTTKSEIYFAPDATGPIDIETVRLGVAGDLPLFFGSAGSAAPPQQVAASCVQAAWAAPPNYDYPLGRPFYGGQDDFLLADWLCAVNGINPSPNPCNCQDAAGMCCLLLNLQNNPGLGSIWAGQIYPVGNLQPNTRLRGTYSQMSSFSDHYVALVGEPTLNGPFVCDACTGPHLGNESPAQYLAELMLPGQTPPNPDWTEYPSSFAQAAPSWVDGDPFGPQITSRPLSPAATERINAFVAAVGASSPAAGTSPAAGAGLISCNWPDPRSCPDVPKAFVRVHYRTTIGYPITERYWVLSDGPNALHVNIWVASDSAATAFSQFLTEGSGHDGTGSIFERGITIGQNSAMLTWTGGKEHLWMRGNVVIRARLAGSGLDLDKIAQWLDGLTAASNASGATLPVISSATFSNTKPAVGDRITLDIATAAPALVAVRGIRPWLRLVDGDGKRLTLLAKAKGTAQASVIVCDPVTLLAAKATESVTVT